MIRVVRQLTNVITCNKLEHLLKTDLLLGRPLKCSNEWKAFLGLLSHNTGTGTTLEHYFDNNHVWKQPSSLPLWAVVRMDGSWWAVTAVSGSCLIYIVWAGIYNGSNYLVRLSQQENNWRSYQQQICAPGLATQCRGPERCSLEGLGGASTDSLQVS